MGGCLCVDIGGRGFERSSPGHSPAFVQAQPSCPLHRWHDHTHAEGTNLAPILPVLSRVFDNALAGGGAKVGREGQLGAPLGLPMFCFAG